MVPYAWKTTLQRLKSGQDEFHKSNKGLCERRWLNFTGSFWGRFLVALCGFQLRHRLESKHPWRNRLSNCHSIIITQLCHTPEARLTAQYHSLQQKEGHHELQVSLLKSVLHLYTSNQSSLFVCFSIIALCHRLIITTLVSSSQQNTSHFVRYHRDFRLCLL